MNGTNCLTNCLLTCFPYSPVLWEPVEEKEALRLLLRYGQDRLRGALTEPRLEALTGMDGR